MVRLSTANTYSYQKGKLSHLLGPAWLLITLRQNQLVLIMLFPTVDLPFQQYVEQLLYPQDPASLGNGEPALGSSGGGAPGIPQVSLPIVFC